MEPTRLQCWSSSAQRWGWTCVDIRCGPGGITDFLSSPVGSTGRVVGLDMNHEFLERARRHAPRNVEFQLGDATDRTYLPAFSIWFTCAYRE
jgi:ubiquinone/menaquinone biosynthesis C-methylase UbiE